MFNDRLNLPCVTFGAGVTDGIVVATRHVPGLQHIDVFQVLGVFVLHDVDVFEVKRVHRVTTLDGVLADIFPEHARVSDDVGKIFEVFFGVPVCPISGFRRRGAFVTVVVFGQASFTSRKNQYGHDACQ